MADTSSNLKPSPKESTEEENDAGKAPTTSKSDPSTSKTAPPKPGARSPTPQLISSSDSDDDWHTSKKPAAKPTAPTTKPTSEKPSDQPSTSKTTTSTSKPAVSTVPAAFKPLASSTPKVVVKANASLVPGKKAPGAGGAAFSLKQPITLKGVRDTSAFYEKYPWLKPVQTPGAPTEGAPSPIRTPGSSFFQRVIDGPVPKKPSILSRPGIAGASTGGILRPAADGSITPISHRAPGTPGQDTVPSFRSLAQPISVTRLASPYVRQLTQQASKSSSVKVTTPAMSVLENMKRREETDPSKPWQKPWNKMSAEEQAEQRKKNMEEFEQLERVENEKLSRPNGRPPATTITPALSTRRVSDDVIRRFEETAKRNEEKWKDGAFKPNPPGENAAKDLLKEIMKPLNSNSRMDYSSPEFFQRQRAPPQQRPSSLERKPGQHPDTPYRLPAGSRGAEPTSKYPFVSKRQAYDPFAPPPPKTEQKKRVRPSTAKKADGQDKTPEKGNKGPQKKGSEEGEERPADDHNDVMVDMDMDLGGDTSASKAVTVKKEGDKLDTTSSKSKKEQEQDARRQELLKPSMKAFFSEEMAAMAKDKTKFERELLGTMTSQQEKLPALPSLSQLKSLQHKPAELQDAMQRLVKNMKRIGETEDSSTTPQGELTKHLNQMMDTMTKDVFLGTVRTEVYEAQDNMFADAASNYIKNSSMTRINTEDYARSKLEAKIAREKKEKARQHHERSRELRRSRKFLAVDPKGKITKTQAAKVSEARRLRRSLFAPKTPPGSPPGNSPPVSTRGSRENTPVRRLIAVTPPGSPPPLGQKPKQAKKLFDSKKVTEAQLDDSFDELEGDLDDGEKERRDYIQREKKKEKDLRDMKTKYDFAMYKYQAAERQKGRIDKLLPHLPDSILPAELRNNDLSKWMYVQKEEEENMKRRPRQQQPTRSRELNDWLSRQKVEKMAQMSSGRPSTSKAERAVDAMLTSFDMDDDSFSFAADSSPRTPNILGKRTPQGVKGGANEFPKPLPKQAYSKYAMGDLRKGGRDESTEEDEDDEEVSLVMGALKGRGNISSLRERQNQRRVPADPPMSEEQLKMRIRDATKIFGQLDSKLKVEGLEQGEREHHINMAVMKTMSVLKFLENALKREQPSLPPVLPISTPSSVPAAVMDSLLLPRVGDAGGDDEDVELKGRRSKTNPQLLQAAADANLSAAINVTALSMGATGKSITNHMSSLWKLTERSPAYIQELARRPLPTTDATKATAVLELRSKIVSVERKKAIYSLHPPVSVPKLTKTPLRHELDSFRVKKETDRQLEKANDDDTTFSAARLRPFGKQDTSREDSNMFDDMDDTRTVGDLVGRITKLPKETGRRGFKPRGVVQKVDYAEILEAERIKKEEKKNEIMRLQRSMLGGVVVGLQEGQQLSEAFKRLPPPTDAKSIKRRVLIRKEITIKEREEQILAEFREYWKNKKKEAAKSDTEETTVDLAKVKTEEGAEKEKVAESFEKTSEEQPGTSKAVEPSEPSDDDPKAAGMKAELEEDNGDVDMGALLTNPRIMTAYNKWRKTRRQSRYVRLNTGNLVDEIELEEVEVPVRADDGACEDTRPFQTKFSKVEESQKDVNVDGDEATPKTTSAPGSSFLLRLSERQRLMRKKYGGEALSADEKPLFTPSVKLPIGRTGRKSPPIIARNSEPMRLPERTGVVNEDGKKRVLIARFPGGGSRLRVVRVTQITPADDVRAVMDALLKKVCGEEEKPDVVEVSDDDDVGADAVHRPALIPLSRQSIIIKKRQPIVPSILRTSGGKSIVWKPMGVTPPTPRTYYTSTAEKKAAEFAEYLAKGRRALADAPKVSSPGKKPVIRFPVKVIAAPGSTRSAPAIKKDVIEEVMDDLLKVVCAQVEGATGTATISGPFRRILLHKAATVPTHTLDSDVPASDVDNFETADDEDEERRAEHGDSSGREKLMTKRRRKQDLADSEEEEDGAAKEVIRTPRPQAALKDFELDLRTAEIVAKSKPRYLTDADKLNADGGLDDPRLKEKEGKLDWINCLRLVEEQGEDEQSRMRRMKKKMGKMEKQWMAVDEATARRIDAKKDEEEKKSAAVGSKMESVGTRNVEKRYFTTKSGKRIILRPKTAVDDGKKAPSTSQPSDKFISALGGVVHMRSTKIATGAGAKAWAGMAVKKPPIITKKAAPAASTSKTTPAGPSKTTSPQKGLKWRPVDMPRLKSKDEENEAPEDLTDVPNLIDETINDVAESQGRSRRALAKQEQRKRRADSSPEVTEVQPSGPKKYKISSPTGKKPTAASLKASALLTRGALVASEKAEKSKQQQEWEETLSKRKEKLKQWDENELKRNEKQKQQEWEMRKNEATVARQKEQIEIQKRLLGELRKEMVKTFESADKTNQMVEKTRRAMIGECHDFAEYRKLVDAREKLMNTLYEQTVEKMKTQVAAEVVRKNQFENFKKKAIKREKALIKEIESMTGQLEKEHGKATGGPTMKAPNCAVPFTKSTMRSKQNRFNYVLEATKRVLGDGVDEDKELEKAQVKAIIDRLQRKFSIESAMSVEQDREFCAEHEIGYRKRIHMKKFLTKLGLDVFCSYRTFDKARNELGEAVEEDEEFVVKREKREKPKTKKEKEIDKQKKRNPREISLRRSDEEDSDFDIEDILVDEDYNMLDGGETSGAERERADQRYNMKRFAGTRLLTTDEEYIEVSDDDVKPGPSNRYIPLPSQYASTSRAPLPPPAPQSHYLHGAPILQPGRGVQQIVQQMSQRNQAARRARGGARVRGGHQ